MQPFSITLAPSSTSAALFGASSEVYYVLKRPYAFILLSGLLALTATIVTAQPVHDISGHRHPHLAAAQRACDRADHAIHLAQEANEFDLGGHAAQALKDLDDANAQLKLAAQTSNQQHAMGHP